MTPEVAADLRKEPRFQLRPLGGRDGPGEEDGAQMERLGVDAFLVQEPGQVAGVAGGGDQDGGPVVLEHGHLVVDVKGFLGDDRGFDGLGPQSVAGGAARSRAAQADLDDVVGGHARRHELPRHEPAPARQVVLGMAGHQLAAFGPDDRMQADDLPQRQGEHAVREAGQKILRPGGREAGQFFERVDPGFPGGLAVAAHVAAQARQEGLKPFQLELAQLGLRQGLVFRVKKVHSQISL